MIEFCLLSLKSLSGSLKRSAECLCNLAILVALGGAGAVFRDVFHHPLPQEAKGFELFLICGLHEVVYIL